MGVAADVTFSKQAIVRSVSTSKPPENREKAIPIFVTEPPRVLLYACTRYATIIVQLGFRVCLPGGRTVD